MPARDLPREKLTPADDLREVLGQCEVKVVALKGAAAEAVDFLHLLDDAHALFQELEAKGIDLRPERSRWETIERQLRSRAKVLVGEVQAAGELTRLREATKPTLDRWWWFLDEEVHRQRRQSLRRTLVGGGIALAILVVAGLLYQRFLAPDPLTRQAIHLSQKAEQAIRDGDLETALVEYNALRELTPDDPETILRLGVIHQVLGHDQESARAYARARDLLAGQKDFFVERGLVFLEVGQWELAQDDAEAALALDPESALAYLILGSVYEAQSQIPEAVEALTQAADLANTQGNSALYALLRYRLGILMGGSGGIGP